MTKSGLPVALLALTILAGAGPIKPLSAQTAAPAAADAAYAAPRKARAASKSATAKARTAQAKKTATKDAPKAPEPWMAVDPARAANPIASGAPPEPKSVVSHSTASDPVEFGGKWNGANDTGEKTRVENYNNDAVGTGGEVGLKLHF